MSLFECCQSLSGSASQCLTVSQVWMLSHHLQQEAFKDRMQTFDSSCFVNQQCHFTAQHDTLACYMGTESME